jgi:hypothetical protein
MKNLLAGLLLIASLISCKADKDVDANLVDIIPSTSLYIIDTPDIGNFLQETDSIDIFENYSSIFTFDIKDHIRILSDLTDSRGAIIAITRDENENLNYVFIAKDHPGDIKIDSVRNKSVETLTYKNFEIRKYTLEENIIFKGEKQGVFIASNSRQQLEQVLGEDHKGMSSNVHFTKAHSAIDKDKSSFILNNIAMGDMTTQMFDDVFSVEINPAHWNVLEIGTTLNAVSINGISTWNEEVNLLNLFQNTGNQINEIAKITPAESRGFYSFTYQNIEALTGNLKSYRSQEGNISADHFLHYTAEAGLISLNNDVRLPVLRATDPELARELLIPMQESNSFRGVTIYNFENPDIFDPLTPLLPEQQLSYYIWIENFIIFAENPRDLEQVISSFLNNMTLGSQEYYNNAIENLAAASSLLIVSNNAAQNSFTSSNNSRAENENGKIHPVITLQFVVERDFAHIHGAFGVSGNNSPQLTGQAATINLDAPLATLAFPVKNHATGQAEIIVQDEENTLYLFSATGSLIWKKQFSHRIIGEITQVDLLKNGNLQYVFSTPYALYVIDRRGNPIKPFPMEFRDEITQPVSIFDYDNNRTYRFVLTQGNNILMYDSRGRAVRGFDFDKLSSEIIQPPKHIRLNNKDYILVPESSGKLNILSRQGKSRIEVKQDIDFSASQWFPYKGNFISVSSEGALIRVSENGNVSTESLGENGNIRIVANDNVLASMADNTLKINDRAVNLDYGLYTPPVILIPAIKPL